MASKPSFKPLSLTLLFLLLHPLLHHSSSDATHHSLCHDHDRSALLQFILNFHTTHNEILPSTWNRSDCCDWDGVRCDQATGHVVILNLRNSHLHGSINSSSTLFQLPHLRRLDLSYNDFNLSPIPPMLPSSLRNLTHLTLSSSNFSGQIPSEVSTLSRLVSLDLSYSLFNGDFPSKIFNLPNLQYLFLFANPGLTGSISGFSKGSYLRHLDLSATGFSGELPNSIGNLHSLNFLDVSSCSFHGTIPLSMANLTQLTYLALGENNFNAWTLPSWLEKLSHLSSLFLDYSNLRGEISSSLANLTQLNDLFLQSNHLTGPIPYWLSNLTRLQLIYISENNLEGSIPNSIFDLQMLIVLELQENNLCCTLEADKISNLKNFEILYLTGNKISDVTSSIINSTFAKLSYIGLRSCNLSRFPPFLQNQNKLEVLDLAENNIHGTVPGWFWSVSVETLLSLNLSSNPLSSLGRSFLPWKFLQYIDLKYNKLHGSIPIPPPSVVVYAISDNFLTGNLPLELCNMTSLVLFNVSNNFLSGTIPPCFASFGNSLKWLHLSRNSFDGTIPQIFNNGSQLWSIDLSSNHLMGHLPMSLMNCSMLKFLDVSDNHFRDAFPYWVANLQELQVFILRSNMFFGDLAMLGTNKGFSNLRIMDVSCNAFSGSLPSNFFESLDAMKMLGRNASGNATYMATLFPTTILSDTYKFTFSTEMMVKGVKMKYHEIVDTFMLLDLSSNRFDGPIPTSISNLKGLLYLNLSNNCFIGHIPPSFGSMTELESLDLSTNKLEGGLPSSLVQLTFLETFNVSYNDLSGIIPHGRQFDTFQNDSYLHNSRLCGDPLSRKCESTISTVGMEKKDDGMETKIQVEWVVGLVGLLSGLIFGLAIGCIFNPIKHERLVKQEWFAIVYEWIRG